MHWAAKAGAEPPVPPPPVELDVEDEDDVAGMPPVPEEVVDDVEEEELEDAEVDVDDEEEVAEDDVAEWQPPPDASSGTWVRPQAERATRAAAKAALRSVVVFMIV